MTPLIRSALFSLVGILGFVLAHPALAQKEQSTNLPGFPLWSSGKKNISTGPFIPGLNAALQLSADQCEKLMAARAETVSSERFRQLRSSIKQNPNATAAEREAARQEYQEACDQFRVRVDAILTAEQRALVASINTAFDEVLTASLGELKNQKGDAPDFQKEARGKAIKDFKQRLEAILSKEQLAALKKAAEEEEAVAKNSVK